MPNGTISKRGRETCMSQVSCVVRGTHQSPMFLRHKGERGTPVFRLRGGSCFRARAAISLLVTVWNADGDACMLSLGWCCPLAHGFFFFGQNLLLQLWYYVIIIIIICQNYWTCQTLESIMIAIYELLFRKEVKTCVSYITHLRNKKEAHSAQSHMQDSLSTASLSITLKRRAELKTLLHLASRLLHFSLCKNRQICVQGRGASRQEGD